MLRFLKKMSDRAIERAFFWLMIAVYVVIPFWVWVVERGMLWKK